MLWTTDKLMRVGFWGIVSFLLATLLSILGLLSCYLAFSVIWLLTAVIYLYKGTLEISTSCKAVMITGCDSGFGNELALHLDRLGFRVFAGCLWADAKGEGAEILRSEGSGRLHVIQLDVTKQEQLDKALAEVKKLMPDEESLWGLVNNAGLCTLGLIEWTPMEIFRRDPEVNFFGMVATTKTFLPLVRRAKGRVVNVASAAGRISVPMMASYCASKYAVEAFSDSLRLEIKQHGVHVAIVEPGNYGSGTELFKRDDKVKQDVKALWDRLNDDLRADYGEVTCIQAESFMNSFRKSGRSDIMPVINSFTEALTQVHPQVRYSPQDPFMYFLVFIGTHMPEFIFDFIIDILGKESRNAGKA